VFGKFQNGRELPSLIRKAELPVDGGKDRAHGDPKAVRYKHYRENVNRGDVFGSPPREYADVRGLVDL
jgi:hypothetical protein